MSPSVPALALVCCILLGGCSSRDQAATTQAVAKVNGEEVTELQVNQILERQRGLKPELVEQATQRAVIALVDQEIVHQKARELKIDREPRVVSAIEAARREIVTRAYLERAAEGATAPSIEEVRAYFDDKPALFKDRRVYALQEVAVEVDAERRKEVEQKLQTLRSLPELEAYLKANSFRVRSERSTVAAENIPLQLVERLAATKPGSGLVLPAANGLRIVFVSSVQEAPVTIEQARPAIEAFIVNQRKRQTVDNEVKALRAAAKVEYLGRFAGLAASAPASAAAAEPLLALPEAASAPR